MNKLTEWLKWLDNNILKVLLVGYIFFIPLYPKIPLQAINYTYIAIRLEDLYVGITVFIFGIQFLRRKVNISKKWFFSFLAFWLAIFLSYFYGYYIQKTIPDENKFVGLLHAFRRVEYMSMFFVAMASVRTKRDFYFYIRIMFVVLGLVCIYGIGQKFLGWPAVQTMNPEFAKGYFLTLDAYARISSTFAGHYDLAAYLILLMPIVIGFYVITGSKKYFVLFVLTLATLVLTASRVSYIAYIVSMTAYLMWTRKFKLLIAVIVLTAILTPLSDNLTKRLTRTFQYTKIYVDPNTGKVIVPKDMKPDDLPPGDFVIGKVKLTPGATGQGTTTDNSIEAIRAKEQIRKAIITEATKSGTVLTDEQVDAQVEENFRSLIPQGKFLPDISQSTRLQVEWPRAIAAFWRNPILGKGPSSITEATDNDYLRWLGEFGLLGTGTFLFILFTIGKSTWDFAHKISSKENNLYYAFLFGFFGLLINASYIDVFEASKVAYMFWLVAGLFMATYKFLPSKE